MDKGVRVQLGHGRTSRDDLFSSVSHWPFEVRSQKHPCLRGTSLFPHGLLESWHWHLQPVRLKQVHLVLKLAVPQIPSAFPTSRLITQTG